LELSSKQQKQVRSLCQENFIQNKQQREQKKELRKKLKEELLKKNSDTAVLSSYISSTAILERSIAQNRINELLKLKKIFTPAQFSRFLNYDWKKGRGNRSDH